MKKWAVIALILLWLGWHLATPINLTNIDLGRHIKNGELIVLGAWDVLYKNYYCYTCPDYPFINHHWLFGVFSFLIWHCLGFEGLSFVYVLLEIIVFLIFFSRLQKSSAFAVFCAFSLLAIPFLACRNEIRPEGFSMLFCGLFWLLTDLYRQGRLKSSYLKGGLFVLQMIWVNTHIYFFLGPLLVFLFWWQTAIDGEKEHADTLKKTFWFLPGACLVNPSGVWGALQPLDYLKGGLGYRVVEAQSVFFMLKHYFANPVYIYFLISLVIMLPAWVALIKKEGIRKHAWMVALMALMSLGAIKQVRLLGPYGLFWIPLTAYAWARWMEAWPAVLRKRAVVVLIVTGIVASATINFNFRQGPVFGLAPGTNDSVEFFRKAGLSGKIFSNYDIGGYLIFHLSPGYKLFVDNRVEAFPPVFFKKIYVPILVNNGLWQKMDGLFDFNVIFFYRNDQTPWGHKFIMSRLADPLWATVFMDENTIIFLKRSAQNEDVIRRYQWQLTKINSSKGEGYRLSR